MWTQVVAKELHGSGVTIACLDPGIVDTSTRREILDMDAEDATMDVSAWLPEADAGALCSPEAAARMVYWLVAHAETDGGGDANGRIFRGTDAAWRAQVERDLGVADSVHT